MKAAGAFSLKLYTSTKPLERDVDNWVSDYDYERTHAGKHCVGKPPWQTGVALGAHQLVESGKSNGKIVVSVRPE